MTTLGYLIVFVVLVAVGLAATLLGRILYIRQTRRSLVKLLGRREGVVAAANGLEKVIQHLLAAGDESLMLFAEDAHHEDRRAVDDVAVRMCIAGDELHALALPKRLWPVAEAMEQAASMIAAQAGAVGEASTPDGVLDALAAIDVAGIASAVRTANAALEPLLEDFHVDDSAVYGGGLYI